MAPLVPAAETRSVVEAPRLLLGQVAAHPVAGEVVHRAAEVLQKQPGHIQPEALTNQDPLDYRPLRPWRQGVGGHLPTPVAQPVGKVVEVEGHVRPLLQGPGKGGDALHGVPR